MIADFLVRLLLALPLVLGLAVATLLFLRRSGLPLAQRFAARCRGWTWPGTERPGTQRPGTQRQAEVPRLELVASRILQPGVRIAVLRHAGCDYLIAIAPQGVTLLATEATPALEARAAPALRPLPAEAAA
ncbi:flagellar biosynthetic protein FliO [Thermaurantiacus sp.]